MPITILLATRNSGRYLRSLLDSLWNQSWRDFRLVARDDGSDDDTAEILKSCADPRLTVLSDNTPSGNARNNFFRLLLSADDNYLMFADADDIWNPDKVEKTLAAMRAAEDRCGADTPLLVHSDLAVVDSDLRVIAPSLVRYEKLSPERCALHQLLAQNNVTGCTVMINRALRALVPAQPACSVMHDWWLALVAAAFGTIEFIDEPLLLYRQHGDNQVGAYDAGSLSATVGRYANRARIRDTYRTMAEQAACFAETFADKLPEADRAVCLAYASLNRQNKPQKIATIVRYGFYKNTWLRNLGQFITI